MPSIPDQRINAVQAKIIEAIKSSYIAEGIPLTIFAEGALRAGVQLAVETAGTEQAASWLDGMAAWIRAREPAND